MSERARREEKGQEERNDNSSTGFWGVWLSCVCVYVTVGLPSPLAAARRTPDSARPWTQGYSLQIFRSFPPPVHIPILTLPLISTGYVLELLSMHYRTRTAS